MPIINDSEFGKVTIRRSPRTRQISIKLAPDGTLRASLPTYAPVFLVKRLLNSSRTELRRIMKASNQENDYHDGMQIGKSHSLRIRAYNGDKINVSNNGLQIIVSIPENMSEKEPLVVREIRDAVIKALRTEAKSYLPRRLSYLAEQHGYKYIRVRFSHASGRWGSCSSNGTISLNIALMKLPFELIDYVIIHELSHTKQMNHSQMFWKLVEIADPKYKIHKKSLKSHNPTI